MDYHKTQVGKMLEQVKKAILAHIPIVYIPTNSRELIDEMFFGQNYHGSIIPRILYCKEESESEELGFDVFLTEEKDDKGKVNLTDNYKVQNGIFKTISNLNDRQLSISFVDKLEDCNELRTYIENYYRILNAHYSKEKNWTKHSLYVIVTPTEQSIPISLLPYVRTIKVEPISDKEIKHLIFKQLDENGISKAIFTDKKDLFEQMMVSFRGFSALHIKQLIDQMIGMQSIDYDSVTENEVIKTINEAKRQMINNIPGLKWENLESEQEATGLANVTKWLEEHYKLFKDPKQAKAQHVDIPGAILLTGLPGSGKSLMAKTAAKRLKMPLISLDMGALRDKYLGESEHNLINALHTAEQLAPCVLWVDEIEKALGNSDQGGDAGVGQRLLGKFLTWMQEKDSACFVFATSNDITKLPPELFRSERFDRKFFTFMPTVEECAEIFVGNLKSQNKKYEKERLSYNKEERDKMLKALFSDESLKKEAWIEVLNGIHKKAEKTGIEEVKEKEITTFLWKQDSQGKRRRPNNKLFTGADISAIIKEAKFKVNSKLELIAKDGSGCESDVVYKHDTFKEAIVEIIKDFRPYGYTNLKDIAKCFLSLYQNQFEAASNSTEGSDRFVFDFSRFYEDDLVYEYDNTRFKHDYNQILYNTVIGAINYYLPKQNREQ